MTGGRDAAVNGGRDAAVTGWHSPVTVVADRRRVDVALPRTVPVGDLLPQLLALCGAESSGAEPARWTLTRVDGRELAADRSLDDAEVLDGEVLALHARPSTVRPAYVEDVRDAVEDAVDSSGRRWTPRATMRFALLLSAAGLAATALVPLAAGAESGAVAGPAVGAGLAAAAGVGGAWWATRHRSRDAAYALAAVACLWGGVTGALLAGWWALTAVPAGAVAVAVALVAAAAARLATPYGTGHLALVVVLAAAAWGLAAAVGAGADLMAAVRVEAVLAVLVVGVLPRVALTAGGLGFADYQVRHAGALTRSAFADRLRDSGALLIGTLLGIGVVGAGLGLLLTFSPGTWDRWLGLLVGLGLVLRSRVFSQVPHVLPVRLAGVAVLAGNGVRLVLESPATRPWVTMFAVLAALLLVAASVIPLSEITRARVRQILDLTEMAVVVALIPVLAGAHGLYRTVAELTG
jgi:type VII secretion integral membrane protein EccD